MTLFICNDTHYRQTRANWFVTRSLAVAVLVSCAAWANEVASQFSTITISSLGKCLLLFSRRCQAVWRRRCRRFLLLLLFLLLVQKCFPMRWLVQIINRCCCSIDIWTLLVDSCGLGNTSVQRGWAQKCSKREKKREWARQDLKTISDDEEHQTRQFRKELYV